MFLQLNPDNRIGAEGALRHPYFAPLPPKLFELPDGKRTRILSFLWNLTDNIPLRSFTETSIFTVEGVYLHPEPNRQAK